MGQEFVDIQYDDFAENQTSIAEMSKVCRFFNYPPALEMGNNV